MPRVPSYDLPQVPQQVGPAPTLNVDTRGTRGEGVAGGLEQLGKVADHIGELVSEERKKADTFATAEAEAAWQHDINDATTKYMQLRGKDALDGYDTVKTQVEKSRADYAEKLEGDQRRMFLLRTGGRMDDVQRQVEGHFGQQRVEYGKSVVQGLQASSLDSIANNYADPTIRARQTAAVEGPLLVHAKDVGASPEETKAMVDDWRSKVDKVVLRRYLAEDDVDGAKGYFAQAKERLGTDAAEFEQAIKIADAKLGGDKTAFDLVNASRKEGTGWVDESAVISKFEQMAPGEKKDRTEIALQKYLTFEREAKNKQIDDHFNTALTALQKRYSLNDIPDQEEVWLHNNAPTEWEKLRNYARAGTDRARSAPPTPDQESAFAKFLVDAHDHPDTYGTMTVERFQREWMPQFAPRDRDDAVKFLAALHGQVAADAKLNPLEQRMLMQTGREAGVFPPQSNDVSKWNDEQFSVFYRASQALSEKASAYKKQTGKPPPDDVMQKWAADAFLKGKVPNSGIFFDDSTTRLQSEMHGTAFEPKFSDQERKDAERALKSVGATVNDQVVEQYLRRKHGLTQSTGQ